MATGAFIGGVIGLLAGGTMALLVLLYGGLIGLLVAVAPSLVGGLVCTIVLRRRHPTGHSRHVKRDLAWLFAVIVGTLDGILLVYFLLLGADGSYLAGALLAMAVVNACVAAVLYPARASIARLWS